ncbi:DUF2752 domain-containing protein [Mucilaginibacter sp.]|uniref:DUF2752 domain-containing protein n=1 Tax=Mucilaginibacter sp. TaxID=1882438 RepID=UPI00284309BA|nr:DUF2752 domain-containing protein [Mucilaginibacter sp.]MDR3697140.1 DUF2752 domain-containing protein [Mucilaginibacter sp.]
MIKQLFNKYFELVFWIAALVSLALTDPMAQVHFSLCPLKALGFKWCPGCGLGHAISFLIHGDIRSSFRAHWLGIPAVIVLLYRIYALIKQRIKPGMEFGAIKSL